MARVVKIRIDNPEEVFTPVYNRLIEAQTRFVLNYGGTGSSKSYSAAQKEVILTLSNKTIRTLVIRKVASTLKDSVIPSFRNRITEFGVSEFYEENKSDRYIRNTENSSELIFRGLDDPEKLKSFEGIDRIFVEEAAELTFDDFLELNRRVRGRENIQVTLNFNPIHENHWLKKHFFDQVVPNTTIIHSTYKDNPFLNDEDRNQIEFLKTFNYNQYRIYALGEWGMTENKTPWLFAFNREKHVVKSIPIIPDLPVYLSFDFNRSPATCVAFQKSIKPGQPLSFIHAIKEFVIDGQLSELCAHIRAYFPNSILFVTGDASGNKGDLGFNERNATYYKMIQGFLNISPRQLNLNSKNMYLNDSRQLVNTVIYQHPNVLISQEGCPGLINDCEIATIDENAATPGKLKKDRDLYKMDLFDAFRYFFQTYFIEYSKLLQAKKAA